MPLSPIIVALDLPNLKAVENLIQRLGSSVDFYKVGMKLFTHYGPEVIQLLKKQRKKVFLDLKFHDIPNTVAEACREAVKLKVDMLTIHTSGGREMMKAASSAVREEAKKLKRPKPDIMGVTVLTSMDSLEEIGIPRRPKFQVLKLAQLALKSNLDGVICSPLEIQSVRQVTGKNFKIVTPGIRPKGSAKGDQKRILTPIKAFELGANGIVMGRPVYESADPKNLIQEIKKDALRLL